MFEEFLQTKKEKDKLKLKGYATILTNFGGLNLELHADRAPKTVYNFIKLAKQGKYDDVIFHRLIPGFMVRSLEAARNEADMCQIQGGDPTGTGSGGKSFWGEPFRDEYDEKGALTHDARGVLVSEPIESAQANDAPVNGQLRTTIQHVAVLPHVQKNTSSRWEAYRLWQARWR